MKAADDQVPPLRAADPSQLCLPSEVRTSGCLAALNDGPCSANGQAPAASLIRCLLRGPTPLPTAPPPPSAQLPRPLLLHALRRLDRASLAAVACCCRHVREITRDVAPGLKLTLFPHQVGGWVAGSDLLAGFSLQKRQQQAHQAGRHPDTTACPLSRALASSAGRCCGCGSERRRRAPCCRTTTRPSAWTALSW